MKKLKEVFIVEFRNGKTWESRWACFTKEKADKAVSDAMKEGKKLTPADFNVAKFVREAD